MLPVYYQMPYPVYHQVVTMDPSPSFRWCPRKMPMNGNLLNDLDVDAVRRDMDIGQLEYLVQHIAFANITDSDRERFSDRAVLKGFMLLQLGVEYLTHLKRPLPTQPDSAELKKALSESQRRVEELEALLYDSELKRERSAASAKIYKSRYDALQREISDLADEDGEVLGAESRSVDPFASVQKEVDELRRCIDQRGKALNQRADQWNAKRRMPRTVTAQQIEELFRTDKRPPQRPQTFNRIRGPNQSSLPT
jgi:polyhydroxyalkanoate synthesis regulator phasin